MKRILHIIGDLRPLLQDRIKAVTPDGYVLGDCLKEIEDIATACAGIAMPVTTEVDDGDTGTAQHEDQIADGTETPASTGGGTVRKGNARERHAQAIATGELKV